MDRHQARSRRLPRSVETACARLLDAMREQFPDGTPAVERRLLHSASRVHRLIRESYDAPSDERVQRLERAFRALTLAGGGARAAGVADDRVVEIIETARTACVSLLLDVLVPLVDPNELLPEDSRAQASRDYR